jgi:hypothetical protein
MSHGNEIDAFLGHYAAALTGFNAKGAADLWAMPGMIIDHDFAGVLNDRETMAQGLEQSYPTYRKLGLASVTHECLDVTDLTEKITLVHVRWYFFDSEGAQLTDSTAYYILRRGDAGLQACVCIQVDDAEKIRALAAERGVDLTP